jgi:hypothetical protein
MSSTTAAELAAAADVISRYRERVSALATVHLGTEREDLVAAIHEAERALRAAHRQLLRAEKLAS